MHNDDTHVHPNIDVGKFEGNYHRQRTMNKDEILRLEEIVLLGVDTSMSYKISSGQKQGTTS